MFPCFNHRVMLCDKLTLPICNRYLLGVACIELHHVCQARRKTVLLLHIIVSCRCCFKTKSLVQLRSQERNCATKSLIAKCDPIWTSNTKKVINILKYYMKRGRCVKIFVFKTGFCLLPSLKFV